MARAAYGVVILAAGRGTRVGGPKALLLVDGVPLALAHVRARAAASAIVVVATADVAAVLAPRLTDPRVRLVINALPNEWGPAGSLRAGVDALATCALWIVGPVDGLPAGEAAIDALLDALGPPEGAADAARFVRGHPIAARASLLREAYGGEGVPPTLRAVLSSARVATLALPADPALTTELDTVEDVVRVTGAPPAFAR